MIKKVATLFKCKCMHAPSISIKKNKKIPTPPEADFKRVQSVKAAAPSVLSASAHGEKPNQRDTTKVYVIL